LPILSPNRDILLSARSAHLMRPTTNLGTPPDELTNLDAVQTRITEPTEASWERYRHQNGGLSSSTGDPAPGSIFTSHSAPFLPGTLDSDTVMSMMSPGCSLRPSAWAALRMAI